MIEDGPTLHAAMRPFRRRELVRLALCLSLAMLGLAVMAGWLLEFERVKSLVPGLPTMKFNTAAGFVLVGVGFAAAASPRLRTISAVSGALLIAIGAATLYQYAASADLGIDELVVADSGTLRGSGVPGRMSFMTATVWMALGLSLLLLTFGGTRRTIAAGHVLASYAGFVAFLAAAGYAFGAEAFLGIGDYLFIAVHTAIGLTVATAAALMTRAKLGWLSPFADSPAARALLARLLPVAVMVPFCLGLLLVLGAGLGAYNAAYAVALFVPAVTLAMTLSSLWVAGRHREAELRQLEYERHLRLVAAELNHRVKNMLAIVQSLAHQSFRSAVDLDQAKADFEGRLGALATAHGMLTRNNWTSVDLEQLLRTALHVHDRDGGRFHFSGPPIQLPPKASVTFAMAAHELATNALKYGALSNGSGRVSVEWSNGGDRLRFAWDEADGPPCVAPQGEGFGTRMLTRALASELGGTSTLRFRPSGLRFELECPTPDAYSHSIVPGGFDV